jgi:hypothetical protein
MPNIVIVQFCNIQCPVSAEVSAMAEESLESLVRNQHVYTRSWRKNCTLRFYLDIKHPWKNFGKSGTTTKLGEVVTSLKEILSKEGLFDPNNPCIVMADSCLEAALGFRAFHLSELNRIVNSHLRPFVWMASVHRDIPAISAKDTRAIIGKERISKAIQQVLLGRHQGQSHRAILANFQTSPVNRKRTRKATCDCGQIIHCKMPWGLPVRYAVQPKFLELLRTHPQLRNDSRTCFTVSEINKYFCGYLMSRCDHFYDPQRSSVCICKGDLLGEALGVQAFHTSQIKCMIRSQLVEFEEEEE